MTVEARRDPGSDPSGDFDVLLLAAGMGTRLGRGRAKGLVALGSEPLFLRSLRIFRAHPRCGRIVLVVPSDPEEARLFDPWLAKERDAAGGAAISAICPGGERRQDSVLAGLALLAEAETEDDRVVLVHDAARPFLPPALIDRLLDALALEPDPARPERLPGLVASNWRDGPAGVIPGLPVRETLKVIYENRVVRTQPRDLLHAVQTPQAFRFGPLLEAHRRAREVGQEATDDAALLEWQGIPVHLVAGELTNLKVTYPEDLDLAERWLASAAPGSR